MSTNSSIVAKAAIAFLFCVSSASLNRASDDDKNSQLVDHVEVRGASGSSSAGYRADGTGW